MNRATIASRPCGVDPSRKSSSRLRHRAKKPDLYAAAAVCTKVRSCLVSSISKGPLRSFQSAEENYLGPDSIRSNTFSSLLLPRRLLCHLLGRFRGLLCLLRFLGHVVLCMNTYSVTCAHRASTCATLRQYHESKLIQRVVKFVVESLAGGTRLRAPPSLHAGVAITVPRSGALLTGLATAVGPASRRFASALC